jgi:hypothetical protein
VEQKDSQDGALPGASERRRSIAVLDLERAKYAEVDHRVRHAHANAKGADLRALLPYAAVRLPGRVTVPLVTRTVPVRVVQVQTDTGFDWGDAAIGAAALLALMAIAFGLAALRRGLNT